MVLHNYGTSWHFKKSVRTTPKRWCKERDSLDAPYARFLKGTERIVVLRQSGVMQSFTFKRHIRVNVLQVLVADLQIQRRRSRNHRIIASHHFRLSSRDLSEHTRRTEIAARCCQLFA
jgi:hypothetical protein